MDEKFFCAVKGRKIEESDCSGIICKADAATIITCRTCQRGQALARTTSIEIKQLATTDAASASAANAQQPGAKNGAWQLVVERTGCTSQEQLAKKIGGTYQSKISQIMVKLGKGITPSGREWNRLLEITGLMPEELLLAAGHHMKPAAAPAESSPASLPHVAASSPLTPDGSASSSAEPSGPAGNMMAMQDAPDSEGEAASEGALGSEAAEQLLDAEQSPKGLFDANVGDYVQLSGGAAPAEAAGQCADIPADFHPYTGQRPMLHGKPALHIKTTGDMELSVDAVVLGGLEHVLHVRPFWSSQRKQIGLVPVENTGPGVLKLQVTPSKRRRISASGFLNGFAIRPKPGTYSMERHPSGLLVATIIQQPAQGGQEG